MKYPHPRGQQTPRVSTKLEILVNLSFSCIPLQKILQKGVDRLVENPQKRAENMTPHAPNKILLAHAQQNAPLLCGGFSLIVFVVTYGCVCLIRGRYSRRFPGWKRTCDFEKRRTPVLVEASRRFVEGFENQGVTSKEVRHHFVSVHFADFARVRFSSGLNSMQKLFGTKENPFPSIKG